MTGQREAAGSSQQGRWDSVITELHLLREAAGTPSYEMLTRRLIQQRIAEGQDEHAARIAKSSVHDVFRLGRSRINESLLKELVRVMGGASADVDVWVAVCTPQRPTSWTPPAVSEPIVSGPTAPARPTDQLLLAVACVVLNLIGREFVDFFRLPVYLDMTGTAIAAIALGPWRGAAVGASTNIIGIIGSGWISLPFALVNITGALLWGYGVRRWGMGRTLLRFFTLNLLTALACSLVAVPIIITFLDRELRVGRDVITQLISESIDTFLVAVGFSNLLTSMGDKLVSGFLALVVVSALPMAFRRGGNLVAVSGETPRQQ